MLTVCCLAAVGGSGACRSADNSAPRHQQPPKPAVSGHQQPVTHTLGQTADAGSYRLTVRSLRSCVTEPYFLPRPGNVKLGISVAIENSSSRVLPVNPFYARLSDAKGGTYYFTLAGCEPILDSTRLEPGHKAEGWLSFEVPVALRKVELTYHPVQADPTTGALRFELALDE